MYDTDTAKYICYAPCNYERTDIRYFYEALYQKKNKEFFLYGSGGAMSKYGDGSTASTIKFTPIDEAEAKWFIQTHGTAENYIDVFGDVSE